MDGSKCYTICGDSLFFAPEIVSQQGYDYAADLWALGIIIHELFEGTTPFGSGDKDETTLYKLITKFKPTENLTFSDSTTTEARDFISLILEPRVSERMGYNGRHLVESHSFFGGITWSKVGIGKSPHVVDIIPTIDAEQLFQEKDLQSSKSNDFDQY